MNNGGVMIFNPDPASDVERVTPLGLEIQFATAVFGHFYLTQLLLPLLIASAKTSPDGKARVLNISSIGHVFSPTGEKGPVDYETIVDGPVLKATPTAQLYSQANSVRSPYSPQLIPRLADLKVLSWLEINREKFSIRAPWRVDMVIKASSPSPSIQACQFTITPMKSNTRTQIMTINCILGRVH